jgi:hypothetical protein
MNKGTKIAAVIGGGALAAGAFAVPALAASQGNGPGPASPPGYQQVMRGAGPGTGDQLQVRARDGSCLNFVASGTLTQAQRTQLAVMAQDEKLTHDLYAQFAKIYGTRVFSNLAAAEAQHLTALRTLMQRYGVTDPTAGKAAGVFGSASVQASYDQLLAQGRTGQQAALKVAQNLEQQAVARYGGAISGLQAPAAKQVYTHLQAAETRHLTAIGNWL